MRCSPHSSISTSGVFIDLGPYGKGLLSAAGADELSVSFAADLAVNTAFLGASRSWRVGMYD
jgi:hypothetical protein